jgi:hypothetical protein
MDLHLYVRVLWRFRLIVLSGLLVAVTLAAFAFVRPGFEDGSMSFTYRDQEQWLSRATLLVTEEKFPEGRAVFEQEIPAFSEKARTITPEFAPSNRFIELANLYAFGFATSDAVRQMVGRSGPVDGAVQAFPMVTNTDAPLPLVAIEATASTPESAVRLAERTTAAFRQYLRSEQERSGIPEEERVFLQTMKSPGEVQLVEGRSKTLPIVIFMTVMLAAVGLAFILENLRPRVRAVPSDSVDAPQRQELDRRLA